EPAQHEVRDRAVRLFAADEARGGHDLLDGVVAGRRLAGGRAADRRADGCCRGGRRGLILRLRLGFGRFLDRRRDLVGLDRTLLLKKDIDGLANLVERVTETAEARRNIAEFRVADLAEALD